MSAAKPQQSGKALHALRQDLNLADDGKVRQIAALLDLSPENQMLRTILDPLRPRLAALRPTRVLRFTRLLFLPLEDLIVPPAVWRPGQASIPRSILKAMAKIVLSELGRELGAIEQMIEGHNTSDTQVITHAGKALWGCAADILVRAPLPADWAETGLRPANFSLLARAIATVLRKAVALRCLLLDAELGVLEPDDAAVYKVISDLAGEPAEGSAMLFKLLLAQLPHAVSTLRRLVDMSRTGAEKGLLQKAMDHGTDDILNDMESQSDLTQGLRDGSLTAVGGEVQRIAGLLQEISHDTNAAGNRARIQGIRQKLDAVCRERFADGMESGIVAPLSAALAPTDSAGQTQLETCARDLRTVETVGRKLGNPANYDALLLKANEAVQEAANSGNLGSMRAIRLVEILSGTEMAEAMYKKTVAAASRPR
jgi:hypothetical protein